jgi:hypothetical protein
MELESDLAKELFNKVIVPLQTKNKEKELTVQNEYKQTQEQLQEARNEQKKLDESKRLAAKVIADEKAQRMAAEKEQLRLERIETERIAQVAEEARLVQEARIAAYKSAEEARLAQVAEEARLVQEARIAAYKSAEEARLAQVAEEARIATEKAAEEASLAQVADEERMSQQSIAVTNTEQVNITPPVPQVLSNKNIDSDSQEQLPPKPPTIETCKASEREVVPTEDCNPMTLKPKPKAWLRFHPDKNVECQDTAVKKFKKLTNICAKYTPSASTFEPPSTDMLTLPSSEPPSIEPPSTDMLTLPSSEPPSIEPPSTDMLTLPSSEPISTELGESILESPIQNKFDVNPLIETLRTTLNKDMFRKTVPSEEPSAIVPGITVPELVPLQEPVPKFNVNQLIDTLNQSLATSVPSVPSVEKTIKVGSPKLSIDQQNNETEEMYMSDLDKVLEEAKKKQYVYADSLSTPVPTSALTPVPTSDLTTALTPVPTSVPEPVSTTTESFDWRGKLDWLKQSVGLLIGSLSNMFTFKPAEDNDPYKLSPERENEGYIYIGKMYMKEEDGTSTPSKQVKYVNYHPEKKEFYIDEKPEVVN